MNTASAINNKSKFLLMVQLRHPLKQPLLPEDLLPRLEVLRQEVLPGEEVLPLLQRLQEVLQEQVLLPELLVQLRMPPLPWHRALLLPPPSLKLRYRKQLRLDLILKQV